MIRLPKFLSFLIPRHPSRVMEVKPVDAVCGIFRLSGEKNSAGFENNSERVLMVKRKGERKFLPGYDAFLWGKVNPDDLKAARGFEKCLELPSKGIKKEEMHFVAALARHMKESLGLDLEEAFRRGEVQGIRYVGSALTPDYDIHRFFTHIYIIDCVPGWESQIAINPEVLAGYRWLAPGLFLQHYLEGGMLLEPVMLDLLKRLAKGDGLESEPHNFSAIYPIASEVPCIEPLTGVFQLMPLSCTFPPINRTNCLVFGDKGHPKVIIDPSPISPGEYKKLVHTLKSKNLDISLIMITHHHLDHHQGAPMLAREYRIPMAMSQYTRDRMSKPDLEGIEVKIVKEGDRLTYWLGKEVKVYEIPGHDEGQLAIAPITMEWFLAGDLIQGAGTVVVGGKDGDMAKYFESLHRIIELEPRVVFPSHGMGMGTTFFVRQTLEHRKLREKQVLSLYKKGKTPEQMVKMIYPAMNRYLQRLALENVHSHLRKLRDEGEL